MADNLTLHAYLAAAGIDHRLVEVDGEARTAAAAAAGLGVELGAIVKSLVCVAADQTVVALVPGDRELSLELLARALQAPSVGLAPRRTVEQATGYPVGGVAPLGHPTPLPVLGEESLRSLDVVYCGGGSHRHMLEIAVNDLDRLAAVRWAPLTTRSSPPPEPPVPLGRSDGDDSA